MYENFNEVKKMKRIFVFLISVMFLAIMLGEYPSNNSRAYGQGFISVSIGVPSVAFSFVGGVNAYWIPNYSSYIYGTNGYYYMWVNGGWVYSNYYYGPWYPIPQAIVLPPVLVYGPPPPVVIYQPYYAWWYEYYAPWWQVYHPYWWSMNSAYVVNYNVWVNHVTINNYYNVTYNRWGVRRNIFAWRRARRMRYFRNHFNTFVARDPRFVREHPNFRATVPVSLRRQIHLPPSIRQRMTAPPAMIGRGIKLHSRPPAMPLRHVTPGGFRPSHPGPAPSPSFRGFRPPHPAPAPSPRGFSGFRPPHPGPAPSPGGFGGFRGPHPAPAPSPGGFRGFSRPHPAPAPSPRGFSGFRPPHPGPAPSPGGFGGGGFRSPHPTPPPHRRPMPFHKKKK